MKQITETETKMTLSEVALVEDALKFYFEQAPTEFHQRKQLWANTYKKVVAQVEVALEEYRNRDK